MILCNKINIAIIPNGCNFKDLAKSKCKAALIEWPNPQPGQRSIPASLKIQSEGPPLPFIKKSKIIADERKINSIWRDKNFFTFNNWNALYPL